jgi:hypothetical protein
VPPAYRPPRPGSSGGARRQQRKRSKKKNKEGDGLWKLPQRWKSQRMLRDFYFMISTAAWKSLLAFPQLPQARRRSIKLMTSKKGTLLSR